MRQNERDEQFKEVTNDMLKLFSKKNADYGDDFFTGGYSMLERWMSIRRKIARLQKFVDSGEKMKVDDETVIDTWMDLANYCVMEIIMNKEYEKNKQE